jgi:hypothetical protein
VSKSNVHPDHYKVGGRDRQDDAAAARMARAKAAKPQSQQRPDRMTKKPWFRRPEATKPAPAAAAAAGQPASPARKKSRSVKAKPAARRQPARGRSAAARKVSGGARRSKKRGPTPK